MSKYVCGFAFNLKQDKVALIEKIKPTWQAGLLNGIGGKLEDGEVSHEAMAREFEEEAGMVIPYNCWEEFARVSGANLPDSNVWKVHFMRVVGVDLSQLKSMEEEQVRICQVSPLPTNVIPNLRWLIPLALDSYVNTPIIIEERNR